MPEKRPASPGSLMPPPSTALVPHASADGAKKPRTELVEANKNQIVQSGPPRTSNLESPIMLLTGHSGEIYTSKFHPEGQFLLSAGFDRQIFYWNVYGECDNFHVIPTAHSGAIVDLHFAHEDGSTFYTASTDKTVGIFDTATGSRIKRLKGHTNFVNSVDSARRGEPLIASGSDDCSIKIWDRRKRTPVNSVNNTYQVTAVSFSEAGDQVISGGIDNLVKIWDLRNSSTPAHVCKGHTDTITSMSLSPDGSYALTNSMDNTLRIWDVRPYVQGDRCVKVITGHMHNFEKNLIHCAWSPDGAMVAAGSADRFVYIWNTTTRRILYKLPGHLGCVNDVDFHKIEPIILSASSDKQIYLGEFEG